MIIPVKTLHISDTRQVHRIFIHFIEKNGIELECEADIPRVIDLFTGEVAKFLEKEFEE